MLGSVSSINSIGSSLKKEDDYSLSNEELKRIIIDLENDIIDGSFSRKPYSLTDIKMMPALVNQANNKYPEMNLKFVMNPNDLPIEIKNNIDKGIESSRFITNVGEMGIHFGVIDYKHISGKTSLILLEPANFNCDGPRFLAYRIKTAIEKYQLPDCHLSIVEMDIQRSSHECGIFSLALAKKLHLENHNLLKIHKDNIDGILYKDNVNILYENLDTYFPVTFYKHAQGEKRLNEYLNTNPQANNTIVNKKDNTILKRFNNNLVIINGKKLSISAHKKRIYEYKSLIKS